ncbi:hypothetical protein STEG23_014661 [Scotinomys teguina]
MWVWEIELKLSASAAGIFTGSFILKSMDGFCVFVILDIMSGEGDRPFDPPLDIPMKFPQDRRASSGCKPRVSVRNEAVRMPGEFGSWVCNMTQGIKALAIDPDNLSSIPKIHIMERNPYVVL